MFSVIFEVHPAADQWNAYLSNAKMLRPELEQIDGFVDNVRYRSLTREGWILSLSGWRDEKAVVRWRTRANHHLVQKKGRGEILLDYHLRVGQITADTRVPEGHKLIEQRLDETEVGEGTAVTLVDVHRSKEWVEAANPQTLAGQLGFGPDCHGQCNAVARRRDPAHILAQCRGRGRLRRDCHDAGGRSPPAGPGGEGLRHVRPA